MKRIIFVVFCISLVMEVPAQQQPPKPIAEPVPHAEHSPGNPPQIPGGGAPVATNPNANITNTAGSGGNTLTNVAVPKAEPSPNAEPKPKSEPKPEPNDHEHSPGNPKHLEHDHKGDNGVGNIRAHLLAAILPFFLVIAIRL